MLIKLLLLGGLQLLLEAYGWPCLLRVLLVELPDLERGVLEIARGVPGVVIVLTVLVDLVLELLSV